MRNFYKKNIAHFWGHANMVILTCWVNRANASASVLLTSNGDRQEKMSFHWRKPATGNLLTYW